MRRRLITPCFIRIKRPIFPEERGRHLLISANHDDDEYRVGLRDGHVRSYAREEIERAKRPIPWQTVFASAFATWVGAMIYGYGWKAVMLALLITGAAVMLGRTIKPRT